jgi:hypothetical protein
MVASIAHGARQMIIFAIAKKVFWQPGHTFTSGSRGGQQVEKLLQCDIKNRAGALSSKLDSGKSKEDAGDQRVPWMNIRPF